MSLVKFRPTLTAQEIQDIITSLELTNPSASALATLKVYAFKQSLGLVKPATISTKEIESEEAKKARIQKELDDSTNFFKSQAVDSSLL